jgi:hypothetical protein
VAYLRSYQRSKESQQGSPYFFNDDCKNYTRICFEIKATLSILVAQSFNLCNRPIDLRGNLLFGAL